MRQDKLSKQNVILYFCGIIPVVWLGLLIAPCLKDGLPGLVQQFGSAMQNPFQIQLCEDSVKTVLTLLLVYGIAIGVYLSTEHNYRRREEHGSAKWGTAGSVNKKYANKDKTENKLLTQNVAIGLDGRKHRRNLNVLVCGGSGAGKTRFYAKPNIMNANTSFVVLDPKGELLRDTGHLLEEKGYEIKVLDLIDMEKSHCYNPFVYISSDDDIQRLTTNLFKNTTPKGSQTQDPFWDQTAAMLLKALVCYLHYEAPPDEQNFSMVMEMIRAGDVKEDNEEYQSVLDELFERLEERNPEHIALKYYRAYHSGSAKTLKSIQISLVSRLEKFNLDSLAGITQCDEMDLGQIGEKKRWRQKNMNSCSTRKRSWKNYLMKRRKKAMKKLNTKKNINKPEIPGKVKKGYRIYVMAVLALTLTMSMGVTAFAAGDPITVVNNLSDFIFGLIRAVGLILLGWGIVQVGLSFQSHDPSQRSNGFLTLAGGVIITFAKEILNLIVG